MSNKNDEQVDLLEQKTQDAIRKHYKAGHRTVVLKGQKFTIKRRDRKVSFATGGKQVKRTESWLQINPVNAPSGLPMGQIELKPMGNLRSQFGDR